LEGTAAFKNRSLAALRRGQDGNIILDQGVAVVEPKALRVRIYSDGQFASSNVPELLANDAPIESRILQARNTLFSLELWQELARESRTLLAFNVHLQGDSITCPFTTGKILVLDLVSLTDNISKSSHPDDTLAQAMYLAFNLLLTYSHRESHRRRTRVPPPLDATKEERPTYSLIRPLVTRINHQRALEYTHALMNPLVQALKSSGLAASYSQSTQTTSLDLDISATERTVRSLIDDLEVKTVFNIMPTVAINIISRTKLLPFSSKLI
jgi:mediator of RNA polymerase II transcription subunit 17